MNIVQLQDRLKDLSDTQLQKEMSNPSGSAPQFLILSELKRRKDMRDRFAASQGGPEQPPMSEQYSQPNISAPPSQGAALQGPQPASPPPGAGTASPSRQFASGGIVQGFQSGGSVSPYFGVKYGSPEYRALVEQGRARHDANLRLQYGDYGPMATEAVPSRGGPLPYERAMAERRLAAGNYGSMYTEPPGPMSMSAPTQDHSYLSPSDRVAAKRGLGDWQPPTGAPLDPRASRSVAMRADADLAMGNYGSMATELPPPFASSMGEFDGTPFPSPTQLQDDPALAGLGSARPQPVIPGDVVPPAPVPANVDPSAQVAAAAQPMEMDTPGLSEAVGSPAMSAGLGSAQGMPDVMKEYYKSISDRQSQVGDMKSRIAALSRNAEAQRQQDMGMALARAGAAMLSSKSPYFAQGAGEGLAAGVDAAAAANKARQDAEMKQLGLEMQVAEAEDRFGLAQAGQMGDLAKMAMSGEQFDRNYALAMMKAENEAKKGNFDMSMSVREYALKQRELGIAEKKLLQESPAEMAKSFKEIRNSDPEAWAAYMEYRQASSLAGLPQKREDKRAALFVDAFSKYLKNDATAISDPEGARKRALAAADAAVRSAYREEGSEEAPAPPVVGRVSVNGGYQKVQ